MRSADRFVGVLYLGSLSEDAFSDKDLDLARQVAASLAVFMENALMHEVLQREKEGLQKLLEITHTFTPSLDSKKVLAEIASCTRLVFNHEHAHLALYDMGNEVMRISPLELGGANDSVSTGLCVPLAQCPSGVAMLQGKVMEFGAEELERIDSEFAKQLVIAGMRALCCFPVITRNGPVGALCLSSKRKRSCEIRDRTDGASCITDCRCSGKFPSACGDYLA